MTIKLNWFGLAGGALTIAAVAVSLFIPWWQLTAGENLIQANISPFNMDFSLFGTAFTIPLIWALNLTSILTFAVAGIVMLIYSVVPTKPYAKHLVGFAYYKPLASLLFFAVLIFGLTTVMQAVAQLNIPLSGSATIAIPAGTIQGLTVSVSVSTGFVWPFWLALVASVLCVVARVYHRKVANPLPPLPSSSPSPQSPPPPPP